MHKTIAFVILLLVAIFAITGLYSLINDQQKNTTLSNSDKAHVKKDEPKTRDIRNKEKGVHSDIPGYSSGCNSVKENFGQETADTLIVKIKDFLLGLTLPTTRYHIEALVGLDENLSRLSNDGKNRLLELLIQELNKESSDKKTLLVLLITQFNTSKSYDFLISLLKDSNFKMQHPAIIDGIFGVYYFSNDNSGYETSSLLQKTKFWERSLEVFFASAEGIKEYRTYGRMALTKPLDFDIKKQLVKELWNVNDFSIARQIVENLLNSSVKPDVLAEDNSEIDIAAYLADALLNGNQANIDFILSTILKYGLKTPEIKKAVLTTISLQDMKSYDKKTRLGIYMCASLFYDDQEMIAFLNYTYNGTDDLELKNELIFGLRNTLSINTRIPDALRTMLLSAFAKEKNEDLLKNIIWTLAAWKNDGTVSDELNRFIQNIDPESPLMRTTVNVLGIAGNSDSVGILNSIANRINASELLNEIHIAIEGLKEKSSRK